MPRPSSLAALIIAFTMSACHATSETENLAEVREQTFATAESIQLSIALASNIDHAQIQEIASYVEKTDSGEVLGAKVQVKKLASEGPTELLVELFGHHLNGKKLEQALRKQFPVLEQATITVSAGASQTAEELPRVYSEAEDPQVAREEIIEQLLDQGVDGDVDVQVSEDEDGKRRIEVRVEKQEILEK